MSSSYALYNRLEPTLRPLVKVSNRKQFENWLWIVVGIVQAKSIALSQIANHLAGESEAESRVTKIRRWLMNFHVDVWAFYEPVLKRVLADWRTVEAIVILDSVAVFGGRLQIFRLSLRHGCRAIPLVWMVIEGQGLTQAEVLQPMLSRAAKFLHPRVKRVRFLADRGFRDCDWASLCLKVHWHYGIRVTCNTLVTLPDGRQLRLDALGVKPSRARYWQQVYLTAEVKLCANLSVSWTEGDVKHAPELLAIISDQVACRLRLREYGWRMCIEQSFRDDQSGGFDMEHTRLQHPERLERLLLAMAIATLWCHELGEQILTEGEVARRQIDPGPTRELSLFQLGLRWLERCLATAIHQLPRFTALLTPLKLKPVVKLSRR